MNDKEKLVFTIKALIVQHENMQRSHKTKPNSSSKTKLLEVDEKFIENLKSDLNKADNEEDLIKLYKVYEDQIILRCKS